MPAPPCANLRVVRYAPGWGYGAAEWERALGAIDWSRPHAEGGPQRLKIREQPDGSRDASVWRATLTLGPRSREQRHDVVLKVEPLDSLKKKLQALVRRTKAFRQWRGAKELDAIKSLRVAMPAAVLRTSDFETLVLEHIPGPTLLDLAAGDPLPIAVERELAAEFSGELGRLTMLGKGGADLKGSNIVVTGLDGTPGARPRIALLDTLDVRRVHRVNMLFPMVAELVGTGHLPRRATLMRFTHAFIREFANREPAAPSEGQPGHAEWTRAERRALWRDIGGALRAHGDPTPKHDPLARG